jgi:hypothetical protein
MLRIHLPSGAGTIGPFEAVVPRDSVSLHSYNELFLSLHRNILSALSYLPNLCSPLIQKVQTSHPHKIKIHSNTLQNVEAQHLMMIALKFLHGALDPLKPSGYYIPPALTY